MNASSARKAVAATLLCLVAGCTSPPSVVPLLEYTAAAIEAEAAQLVNGSAVERERVAHAERSLDAAFAADLRETDTLTIDWVSEATAVYVAAREALIRHELELQRQREARAEQLRSAALAQRRAIELLQQRDRLIVDATAIDAWRWLRPTKKDGP